VGEKMMSWIGEFFKGFWGFIGALAWWQGLIVLVVVMITFFIGKYWKNISKMFGSSSDTLQYRMFWGLISDAFNIKVKDEIRRSFKENGFHDSSGNDFSIYVKNQSNVLVSILKDHIMNLYPPNSSKMVVNLDEILDYIDKNESVMEDRFFEIYIEAKKLKKYEVDTIATIDKKFEEEIGRFIKKKTPDDCKNCLIILFGKREIAENKKNKIKTLKSQMNFTEQKLTEIMSDFLTFFSEKISNKNK
jgi:hypothetical protein